MSNINEKRETNKPTRNISLDIIRIFAFFCVVSVHYFSYIGFYGRPVLGTRMFIMTTMRSFFMICVPLFVILTGYLESSKTLCKEYFVKIKRVIFIYILASITVFLYKWLFLHNAFTFKDLLTGILDFSMANYAWYIEMYIGLFLLIPFLNILYHNLSKKSKQGLLLVMIFLTALSSIINVYNFKETGWWNTPSVSTSYQKLIPSWWEGIWPLTYYFIGCYLKEYPITIKKFLNFILILITTLLFGAYNYWHSFGGDKFIWGPWQSWGALPILILAVFVFIFFLNINMTECPRSIKFILKHCSNACLGAFLVSVIFDNFYYPKLNKYVTDIPLRLNYYPIMAAIVFLSSLALSLLLSVIYNGITKIISSINS